MLRIEKIKLEQARPYDLCQIEPSHHLNVVYGHNGTGKTTVLEAIYIALTGKSFKASRLKEFIQNGKEYCKIQLLLSDDQSREVVVKPRSKELFKNGSKVKALSEFCQGIACVSLIPEDIAMINGSSQQRRKYLDHILFYQDTNYGVLLQNYKKALTQKNSLLKAKLDLNVYLDQVAPWHQQMVEFNQDIRSKRQTLLNDLKEPISSHYSTISNGIGELSLEYQKNEDDFAQALEEKKALEHALGRTLLGSHKDDICFALNHQELSSFASQGERASALLALKFAELDYIKTLCENIVLLLDDIGGTLDEKRRQLLLQSLSKEPYPTFIATADKHIAQTSVEFEAQCYRLKTLDPNLTGLDTKTQVWKAKNILDESS